MAANEEFPRGWRLRNGFAPGVTPLVSLPATSGVVHVLEFALVQFLVVGPAAGAVFVGTALYSPDSGTTSNALCFVGSPGANVGSVISFDGNVSNISSIVGAALQVFLNFAVPANYNVEIIIYGHDT